LDSGWYVEVVEVLFDQRLHQRHALDVADDEQVAGDRQRREREATLVATGTLTA
jgi:hypothetical protein